MAYHHRIATIALTLALAAGVPAAAAAQQPGPGSPATASPCSEVCSGGGYGPGTSTTTQPAYSIPMILNDLGNQGSPAPCSEVCSGGGYGTANPPSPAATFPPTAVRGVTQRAGFDWGDAGIGAGGMLALIVIGLGGALTLTRRRNHHLHPHAPQNGRSEEKRVADQPV